MPARMKTLPEALRLLRESRGKTQDEIATAVGVTESVVSRWERGELVPDLHQLGRLADHLGLSLGDLDDALVLAGGWPPRRTRTPAGELDPRRLAQQALGHDDEEFALEPVETVVTDAFAAVIEMAKLLRALK